MTNKPSLKKEILQEMQLNKWHTSKALCNKIANRRLLKSKQDFRHLIHKLCRGNELVKYILYNPGGAFYPTIGELTDSGLVYTRRNNPSKTDTDTAPDSMNYLEHRITSKGPAYLDDIS